MQSGKPTIDDEQPSVTEDTGETDESNDNSESAVSRVISTARNISEIVAPFTGVLSALVHAITAFKFFKEAS